VKGVGDRKRGGIWRTEDWKGCRRQMEWSGRGGEERQKRRLKAEGRTGQTGQRGIEGKAGSWRGTWREGGKYINDR
jgi:hypothetical protein